MTVDWFYKTYPADFPWMVFSLRSLQKFATGFRKIVVVCSEQQPPTGTAEQVYMAHESGDPYMTQQLIKMHADCFTDAEFIAYMDSDTILTTNVTPDSFIVHCRRPIAYFTPYASLGEKDRIWQKPTSDFLGEQVTNEFMRRHPFVIPRKLLSEFRAFCWQQHGHSIESYVRGLGTRDFSEFNAIGAYLFKYHHDKMEWRNTDEQMGESFVMQSWSYGGITPEIRATMEGILA